MGRCRIHWLKPGNGQHHLVSGPGATDRSAHVKFAQATLAFCGGELSLRWFAVAGRCEIPRQGVWVARIGADVDAVRGPRDLPISNHSLIVGKELTLSSHHLFHEQARLRIPGREMSNLIDIPRVLEHIRENHGVPRCEGDLQRLPGSVLRRLAREILDYGSREVQECFGDFSIGIPRCSAFAHLSPSPELLF